VNLDLEGLEEAAKEGGRSLAPAIVENLDVDKARGAIDRNIGVGALAMKRRQVFDVEMNEAGRRLDIEPSAGSRSGLGLAETPWRWR
jgi:hypothetical protein